MSDYDIFGKRLQAEMDKRGLSYRAVAELVGMTTTTMCRYAKCHRVPRATEVLKIADALGVTCDYMLGLSDDPHKTADWDLPSLVRVIRCKDCKHRCETENGEYNPEDIVCAYWMSDGLSETDYCSYAERLEE